MPSRAFSGSFSNFTNSIASGDRHALSHSLCRVARWALEPLELPTTKQPISEILQESRPAQSGLLLTDPASDQLDERVAISSSPRRLNRVTIELGFFYFLFSCPLLFLLSLFPSKERSTMLWCYGRPWLRPVNQSVGSQRATRIYFELKDQSSFYQVMERRFRNSSRSCDSGCE